MIGELTVCVRVSECGTVCAVQSTYFFVCLANATESSGTITRYGLPWLRLCTHCRWVRTHSYLISFPPSSIHPPPSLVARRQLVIVGPPPHTWQINSVIFFLRIIFFAPHFFVDIYIICYWISGINKLIASEVLIALFFCLLLTGFVISPICCLDSLFPTESPHPPTTEPVVQPKTEGETGKERHLKEKQWWLQFYSKLCSLRQVPMIQ